MPKLYYKSGSSWINALNIFYPVGAFYISNVSTSPATLLGGTWAQVTNAAIRGASSTGYIGSDSTTLAISQIPSHTHTYDMLWTINPGNPQLGGGGLGFGIQFIYGTGTSSMGGGNRTPTFSALTIASFGTALPKRGWC